MASFDPYPKFTPIVARPQIASSEDSREIQKLANNAFFIGVLAFFVLGVILGPIAILSGNKAMKQIKTTGIGKNYRSTAQNGVIMGAIATFLHALIIVGTAVLFALRPELMGL